MASENCPPSQAAEGGCSSPWPGCVFRGLPHPRLEQGLWVLGTVWGLVPPPPLEATLKLGHGQVAFSQRRERMKPLSSPSKKKRKNGTWQLVTDIPANSTLSVEPLERGRVGR